MPSTGVYTSVIFREVQRFNQIWIWLLLLSVPAVFIWGFIQQIVLGNPFGNNPMSDIALIIVGALFGLGLPALFLALRLITEVRSDGLYYRFVLFHRSFQRLLFEEIIKYEIRTYKPIKEYGGWGIRLGAKGRAYNVSGNLGLQLELTNGRKILLGTQQPAVLLAAIEQAAGKK